MGARTLASMVRQVKVGVAGVGNNISALVQGTALHRATGSLVGIHKPVLAGLGVGQRRAGYLAEAAPLLKSPPGTSV